MLVWPLSLVLESLRTWRWLGIIWSGSRSRMCVMAKKEKDTVSANVQSATRCSGLPDYLLVCGRKFLLIFVAACMIGCAYWSFREEGTPVSLFCIGDDGTGWERSQGVMIYERLGWDGAFWWFQTVGSPVKRSISVIRKKAGKAQ